jgi:homospermidine synthase
MAKSIPKVSGMDWIVENLNESILQPDEFTARMVADKAKTSLAAVRCKLQRMFDAGKVTRRKILEDGHLINAYKRVV